MPEYFLDGRPLGTTPDRNGEFTINSTRSGLHTIKQEFRINPENQLLLTVESPRLFNGTRAMYMDNGRGMARITSHSNLEANLVDSPVQVRQSLLNQETR